MIKTKLALLFAVALGLLAVPAAASAACTLPAPAGYDEDLSGAAPATYQGNFGPELRGKFVQIPFTAPAGMTGMRIRYCYDEAAGNPPTIDNTTLDLGVYEPNSADPGNFTMAQRRGWSGSAIKIAGIGENGFTDPVTYETSRKAYVAGRTSRAFQPGQIPAGKWAVELGAGYIDPALTAGADWTVEVTFTDDPTWTGDEYQAQPYEPNVANPAAGWYTGDLHVHGEQEPGNAQSSTSADLAFTDPPTGVGLDFITLVDHNNDVTRTQLGPIQNAHPGRLIIPGTEMTTYDGHFNSQNSEEFTDFRLGEIKKIVDDGDSTLEPGELQDVRGPEDPSDRFRKISSNGGWAQINHPTIWKDAPALCRGCAWNYDASRTDFSTVDAIELQTGPAGLPAPAPTGMNPFTPTAIEYYEAALNSGAHIAAIGSSDDHQAKKTATGVADSTLGQGSTVVHAEQLSQAAITQAIKDGHTYVKPFGPDAPDVEMKAGEPGKADLTAIPGDSVASSGGGPVREPAMNIQVKVTGADSGIRPGPYTLQILRDGAPIDSIAVSGATFNHAYTATESGRYSFKLTRLQGSNTMIEAYSTPIWFTAKDPVPPTCETDPSLCPKPPSNAFSFRGLKLNKKKGIARLKVRVSSPGTVKLTGKRLAKSNARVKKKNQIVVLNIKPKGKLKKRLRKRGKASVRVKVRNRPTGGKALTKSKKVKLKMKRKKAKKK